MVVSGGMGHAEGRAVSLRRIIAAAHCPVGQGVFVEVDGRELAVFRLERPERYVVMDNTCPHAGGNLSGGDVSGETVACPWHGWAFSLATGQCTLSERARVRVYLSEVRDGHVWTDLDGADEA